MQTNCLSGLQGPDHFLCAGIILTYPESKEINNPSGFPLDFSGFFLALAIRLHIPVHPGYFTHRFFKLAFLHALTDRLAAFAFSKEELD